MRSLELAERAKPDPSRKGARGAQHRPGTGRGARDEGRKEDKVNFQLAFAPPK
jgi:hypothetical protein